MSIQACSVEVDHAIVHYSIAGPESGAHIVLLHGASFSKSTWEEIGTVQSLANAGFRVFSIDLPGFGESEAVEIASTRWLSKFFNAASIESPVLVAPSMSGRFALPLATSNDSSELIAGLVAVAPVGIPKYQQELGQIKCPVLAVWGEQDQLIPLEQADQLVELVANGEKVVIAGAGHAPYMDKRDEFNEVLLGFAKGLAANRARP